MLKKKAWNWIDDNIDEFIKISDLIWEYAELGLVEEKSSKILAKNLNEHGFDVELGVAGMPTAIHAKWGTGKPVIGFQAEYDALPGISNKVVPYKEALRKDAPGHGCGHNIHGVSALAAVIAVRYLLEKEGIPGTVRFFGTPAEENYSGKVFMVREGVYEGIDVSLSHHPGSMNTVSLGSSNAVNGVKFHFYGKTSHAAGNPEQGRSALDAIELMNIGVNFLREHIIPDARVHYVIEVGGGQPNVVPDYARSWYYIRAPERDSLDPIYKRILKIAEGAALMTETKLEVEFIDALYNKIPNKVLSEIVIGNMREIGAPEYSETELIFAAEIAKTVPREQKIASLKKRKVPNWEKYIEVDLVTDILDPWNEGETSAGSTDVSDVSWQCPTIEFGTTSFVLGAPGHSWQHVSCSGMSIGHKSLIFAAKTMAGSALDLLTKPELIKNAKDEFKDRLKGRSYKCPIPPEIGPPLQIAREAAEKLKGSLT
jgi:aminobenzoyl-glutamate utilization protein B